MALDSEDEKALYVGEQTGLMRSSKGRKCIVVLLCVALVAILLGIIVPVALNAKSHKEVVNQPTGQAAITAACQATQYPETCSETLANSTGSDGQAFTRISVIAASSGVNETLVAVEKSATAAIAAAVDVCLEVLGLSSAQLELVLSALNTSDAAVLQAAFGDIKTRLSAAMELHTTCIDTLVEVGGNVSVLVQAVSDNTNMVFSNSLAFVNALSLFGNDLLAWATSNGGDLTQFLHNRRLLSNDLDMNRGDVEEGLPMWMDGDEGFPAWMGPERRRHLLQTTYNVKVAADGTGSFQKIQDAVDAAPKTNTMYVIYIKAGTYQEQVKVSNANVMFVGDGATKTVITGNLSVALTFNMTTFKSATLIVSGDHFQAKGITVQNTAGANGHQAVAVRVTANFVAFYQCNIDSWQDSLYAHTLIQYYRECNILGTVDYIFGNSQAAFQNCALIAKKSPLVGQQNTYTAQGKTDKNMVTGFSFQNCTFDATVALIQNQSVFKTYLGRPWKPYSTAVLLRSTIQGHVDPTGWLPWNTSTFGLYTSYFAEFQSKGPGANPTKRVSWSKQITKLSDANKWQAKNLINGSVWVPATEFPYDGALLV